MWTCPKCASKVDPSFEVCWNCGTSPDGVVDPSFVSADDSGPIEADPVFPALDVDQDVKVMGELPEPIRGELVEAYMAMDVMEAKFLSDQLNLAGIQAAYDTHDLRHSFGPAEGEPRVWVREEDFLRARDWLETYERNKVGRLED